VHSGRRIEPRQCAADVANHIRHPYARPPPPPKCLLDFKAIHYTPVWLRVTSCLHSGRRLQPRQCTTDVADRIHRSGTRSQRKPKPKNELLLGLNVVANTLFLLIVSPPSYGQATSVAHLVDRSGTCPQRNKKMNLFLVSTQFRIQNYRYVPLRTLARISSMRC